MKLFILAAGVGSRLYPLTKNTPKSLLDLNDGSTLLERQVGNAIKSKNIDEICIITGYRTEQIEAKLHTYAKDANIRVIYNPFFDVSNNLMSVWCASKWMLEDDFIITNGDNIYLDDVMLELEKHENGIYLTIDKKEQYDADDMKVLFGSKGELSRISKEIPENGADAESVGLVLVHGQKNREVFVQQVEEMIRRKENLSVFWLEIFNELIKKGFNVMPVEIGESQWREIDFHGDVVLLRKEVMQKVF